MEEETDGWLEMISKTKLSGCLNTFRGKLDQKDLYNTDFGHPILKQN